MTVLDYKLPSCDVQCGLTGDRFIFHTFLSVRVVQLLCLALINLTLRPVDGASCEFAQRRLQLGEHFRHVRVARAFALVLEILQGSGHVLRADESVNVALGHAFESLYGSRRSAALPYNEENKQVSVVCETRAIKWAVPTCSRRRYS